MFTRKAVYEQKYQIKLESYLGTSEGERCHAALWVTSRRSVVKFLNFSECTLASGERTNDCHPAVRSVVESLPYLPFTSATTIYGL